MGVKLDLYFGVVNDHIHHDIRELQNHFYSSTDDFNFRVQNVHSKSRQYQIVLAAAGATSTKAQATYTGLGLGLRLGFVNIRVRVSVRVRFCGHYVDIVAANCGRLRLQPTVTGQYSYSPCRK